MKPKEESAAAAQSTKSTGIREQLKMVSGPVYIAVMLFAMSTWIAIGGIWVEMPLLVNTLPESWNLPSYLVIIIQCANLGPATYAIWDKMRRRKPNNERQQQQQQQHARIDTEVVVSLIILFTTILSMLLLSLFWDRTAMIASENRSVALLILVFLASLSCCTSSVVFLPYMARFRSVYISAFYLGMGLSGLVPGLLGLVQVAELQPQCRNEPDINDTVTNTVLNVTIIGVVHYSSRRFSVSAFFVLITVLLCVSAAAFCCLNFAQKCRGEMTASDDLAEIASAIRPTELTDLESREYPGNDVIQSENIVTDRTHVIRQRRRFLSLLVTIFIISALWNGVMPSTQSYTCLPYGNIVYKLSVSMSSIVSPLAALPDMVAPTSSLPLINGLSMVASVIGSFRLFLAAQSPHPILQGSVVGQVIVVS